MSFFVWALVSAEVSFGAVLLVHNSAVKSQNTVKPNPLCRLPVTSPLAQFPLRRLPETSLDGEVGVMEFGLKGTSRLVEDVTGSRHSGLGFTVFWLFYGRHSLGRTDGHTNRAVQNLYPPAFTL